MTAAINFVSSCLTQGDCCAVSCLAKSWEDCRDGDKYCIDDRYRWVCDFGDYDQADQGDGHCDIYINTETCHYDGGRFCFRVLNCARGTKACRRGAATLPHRRWMALPNDLCVSLLNDIDGWHTGTSPPPYVGAEQSAKQSNRYRGEEGTSKQLSLKYVSSCITCTHQRYLRMF